MKVLEALTLLTNALAALRYPPPAETPRVAGYPLIAPAVMPFTNHSDRKT
jgi:hypothetical protein